MRIYTETATCSVCGEDGAATIRTASAEWLGAFISHKDPRVCADNLARKKREEEKRKQQPSVIFHDII